MRPQSFNRHRRPGSGRRAGAAGRTIAFATVLGLFGTGVAAAEITITFAEYAGGVLVVRGETSRANQRVTLDRRYVERTSSDKTFTFRIRYLPRDCTVQIRAGREVRPAHVSNCQSAAQPVQRGSAKTAPDSGAAVAEQATFRAVARTCHADRACRVSCRSGEFAVNAFCLVGRSRLVNERTVACSEQAPNRIVAYCIGTRDGS